MQSLQHESAASVFIEKNIKDVVGKPMIAYSIETILQSGIFLEVMVSTDVIEMAEVAHRHGAEVPFMCSAKNSDQNAINRVENTHSPYADTIASYSTPIVLPYEWSY